MKIYTAATFTEQKRIRQHKESLFNLGHSVVATWLEEQIKPTGMTDEQFRRKMAAKDLQEIATADCFILDLEKPSITMGKMVETGFAIAKHKLLYVVAPEGTLTGGHIFLLLADRIFKSWDELFAHFREAHTSTDSVMPDIATYLHKAAKAKKVSL
jgi:nucleoside 2-deoxyribosyltransferase